MEKILVSACLLGENCKYSGGSNYSQAVVDFFERNKGDIEAVPVCPEAAGGLQTPRIPSEIRGNAVITENGQDVTAEFIKGAEISAALAEEHHCRRAVLKARSPSCGSGRIYDGSFTGKLIPGDGVTAAMLKKMGIRISSETDTLQVKESV